MSLPPDAVNMHYKKFTLRLPSPDGGTQITSTLNMMEDSGASIATLYEDDIKNMMYPRPHDIPVEMVIGRSIVTTSNGQINQPLIKVEICLPHEGEVLIPWTPIQALLVEGRLTSRSADRLLGPVLRRMAYTATAPDNRDRIYIANSRNDLLDLLPEADISKAFVPEIPIDYPQEPGHPVFY
ncbi:hypothetical protein N7509_009931 [Penicillium cosmopolitanum]|uniref:Uncharacterized protein n=1 Tax=Penicillium cosmopolitanum TaxID=1131564 RepID=A0A9W9VQH5_9EURO|nr:uncharacterized protein N7509_009931 [Penicillium cosmopolitanum]KAJ5387390.1 hypothetical protein N7509_009931 [Penicillium cosmopolitanum]